MAQTQTPKWPADHAEKHAAAPGGTIGPYAVLLADPPWHYWTYNARSKGGRGAAAHHYQTLHAAELAALPVRSLAARDAALLMWATMPTLPEALALMAAWGFSYRTVAFTWIKLNRDGSPFLGLGHYTRGNAELCLLGTRGRVPRLARDVPQVIMARRREHSRKPDQQYGLIERLFGDVPRVELFARQCWPGWSQAFSNQARLYPAQPPLTLPCLEAAG